MTASNLSLAGGFISLFSQQLSEHRFCPREKRLGHFEVFCFLVLNRGDSLRREVVDNRVRIGHQNGRVRGDNEVTRG